MLGVSSLFCNLYSIFDPVIKQGKPDLTPHFACLPLVLLRVSR